VRQRGDEVYRRRCRHRRRWCGGHAHAKRRRRDDSGRSIGRHRCDDRWHAGARCVPGRSRRCAIAGHARRPRPGQLRPRRQQRRRRGRDDGGPRRRPARPGAGVLTGARSAWLLLQLQRLPRSRGLRHHRHQRQPSLRLRLQRPLPLQPSLRLVRDPWNGDLDRRHLRAVIRAPSRWARGAARRDGPARAAAVQPPPRAAGG